MHNIHFLLGTESHLDESVTNSEVAISKSCTFTNRKRQKIYGGRVFILVEELIPSNTYGIPHLGTIPCINSSNYFGLILYPS